MNKKTKIYVLSLIWGAIAVQLLINTNICREKVMVTQVMTREDENVISSEVKAYAYYGNEVLSNENRLKIVKKMASKLGIISGYDISMEEDNDRNVVTLKKKGSEGDTCIRLVSSMKADKDNQEINNYITMEVLLKASNSDKAYMLKQDVSKIYKSLGMKANANIYICSQRKGTLSEVEIGNEVSNFMKDMNAKEIERVDLDNTICVYGYSRDIDEYVYQGDSKVNVNIAISYDENEDVSYIHRAVPFIDKSF